MLPWILGGTVGTWLGFMMFHTGLSAFTFAILGGAVGSAIAKSRVVEGGRRGDGAGSCSDGGDGGTFGWPDGGGSCDGSNGGGDDGGCD